MIRPVSDLDVAAAVRVSARAEVIASEAEHEAGNAGALQVALDEFDYWVAQSEEAQESQLRRWEDEHAERTRRHELALQLTCPHCGAAPGDVCRTTGSAGPMAKGLDDHKARYRAATSEPSAERGNRTV